MYSITYLEQMETESGRIIDEKDTKVSGGRGGKNKKESVEEKTGIPNC